MDKDQVKEIVAEKEVDLVVVSQDQVQVCVCVGRLKRRKTCIIVTVPGPKFGSW